MQEKRLKYKSQPIEEDTAEGVNSFCCLVIFNEKLFQYKKSLWSVTCKLFADIERLRVREEANKTEERKRKAEETTDREERTKLRKEWDKNYEVNKKLNCLF